MLSMNRLKTRQTLVVIAVAVVSFFLGIGSTFIGTVPLISHEHAERAKGEYELVSPLLSCGETKLDHLSGDDLIHLQDSLENYIQDQKQQGTVALVGVYFRQLKGGPWLGINFEHKFIPGSLLKVPLAMALYKASDKSPGFFDKHVFFEEGDATKNQYFKDTHVTAGNTYTVRELLDSMLIYSDNNAANLLASTLPENELIDTYRTMGISEPEITGEYAVTVKDYASFFRVLYNSTYLTPKNSEELLSTLTKTRFARGLVAGVPWGTKVAHKFGERYVEDSELVQLHDCGIVYYQTSPYLLCVMTQGKNFEELATTISSISKIVYDYVD